MNTTEITTTDIENDDEVTGYILPAIGAAALIGGRFLMTPAGQRIAVQGAQKFAPYGYQMAVAGVRLIRW